MNMVDTWWIPGGYLVDTWWIPGGYLVDLGTAQDPVLTRLES